MEKKDNVNSNFSNGVELDDESLQLLEDIKESYWGKPKKKKQYKDKSKLKVPSLYDKTLEKLIINKMNELYIMTRYRHLLMLENGTYITIDTKERPTDRNGKKSQPLHDAKLENHLRGGLPVGIFAGEQGTKVITFDVDQPTREEAIHTTYKTINALYELGIKDNIHISDSGSKGYHIDLFLDGFISNESAYKFYQMVIDKGELDNLENGEVEFRPNGLKQGVKLPLGIHQKTKRRCWFVDLSNGLKPIEDMQYILNIKQMDRQIILDILDSDKILWEDDENLRKNRFKYNNKINKNITEEDVKNTYKPLKIYDQNIIENYTIDYITDILKNGIKHKGSRHNCLFMLSKYFKCECGMNETQIEEALTEWMEEQDTNMYSTSWEECIADIKYLSSYVHDKDIQMVVEGLNKELNVYKSEMDKIMTIEEKNPKLLLYSMNIHSKRYADRNGIFYMTYQQLMDTTGIKSDKTITKYINYLEQNGYIEIVSRNKIRRDSEGNFIGKYPNKYKVTLNVEVINEQNNFTVIDGNKNYKQMYYKNICQFYSNQELKIMCNSRQYNEFTQYRNGRLAV